MSTVRRKIGVVTGTRAEYGLLRWVMQGIKDSELLDLQLIVTGMHLSPEFGLTVKDIEADGFSIDRKVEMLLSSDTPTGITKSIGLGMIGFADALTELQPDLLVVLGDRYEILAAASAALIARVPIAHIHGGELTEGAFDDAIRHSVTKMANLHFVAAEEYLKRVIQLGEQPETVYNVGGLGIDNILRLTLLTRTQLEKEIDFKLSKRNLLITFHPVTLESDSTADQMEELLAALEKLDDIGLIFTMPNADTDGRNLFKQINAFCESHPMARAYTSLGQLRYLSCIKHVDGVIGNSSSGLTEVPSFRKGTLNIGDRQRGRLCAASVINCPADHVSISESIQRIFSPSFLSTLPTVKNPYGDGGASEAIVKVIEQREFTNLLKKSFFDFSCL
ncbi:UDP-N-acetylglucosamine 2-epimerase [Parasynechococcus marenigrum]|uniref:N-acetylglucosamine-6-phosphate 2-epimerase/N-acetylglucosamine-6-phosphatase n=1 Tax=Parasynechococcus marenigrum (strain WH8102) TaxID=84588 RepID=Q7U910_PARMW|nr:UDP-N-acetylglucosamine 2-epimerase [Parasynechococcus marenigrum]CAE06964.1 putative N-acetylglucosamine-6-phosphate 2-epimerase/N-acetylglucosamine-6-phosphatase [Parasynechococcus marenigrum WH 8102]